MKRVIYPGPAVPPWDRKDSAGKDLSGWSCAAGIELLPGENVIQDDAVADALIAGGTVTLAPDAPAAAPKAKDKDASPKSKGEAAEKE